VRCIERLSPIGPIHRNDSNPRGFAGRSRRTRMRRRPTPIGPAFQVDPLIFLKL
jgi:hypothetical protein